VHAGWGRQLTISDIDALLWERYHLFVFFFAGGTAIELVVGAETQTWRGRFFNLAFTVSFLAITFVVTPTLTLCVNQIATAVGMGLVDLTWMGGGSLPAQMLAALLYVFWTDCFFYWAHRAMHQVPVLWDFHAVHHADQEVNVTTASRVHWMEILVQQFLVTLPLTIFFKLPSFTLTTVSITVAAWTFFNHLNLKLSLGRLSVVVCGPQVHRIHHSRLPEHQNKNFASYTPIWDLLFGTYYAPAITEYPPTGLDSGERICTIRAAHLYPLARWSQRLRMKIGSPA
jgi:sterol desaturase/sphingolipid hydroxylase (fatty acid hydroxylase superfamily)